MSFPELSLLFLAAVAAGAVNAVAGGGTLISFPVLLALGVPPIAANVTNAVALCPGYFGASVTQWRSVRTQHRRMWICIPAAIVGGLVGATILVHTREQVFQKLVPYMLFIGSLLLAVQGAVRRLAIRKAAEHHPSHTIVAVLAVGAAAIYGGFFSAGMSVIVLAVLALTLDDTFTRLNALKQVTAFAVNVAAVAFFVFTAHVIWSLAAIMAIGALLGGAAGGHIVERLPPAVLRWSVVCVGFGLAVYYWIMG